MNLQVRDGETAPEGQAQIDQILKVAILAVGGQGGGVLNGWIVALADRCGYAVQATSIAGVAQRTGSTVYYIEMRPGSDQQPVFALAPTAGDVDIVIAAELMEAGRAITRGFVTPGRTRMVLSTHRQFATMEKSVPGDGTADSDRILAAVEEQSASATAFDLQAIAEGEGTMISAALFGAIAGAGFLPFEAEEFRETIRASGRGVDQSLAAFERARALAAGAAEEAATPDARQAADPVPQGPDRLMKRFDELAGHVEELPQVAQALANAGLRKMIEFQDLDYGSEYLNRLQELHRLDGDHGGADHGFAFTAMAAKYLANAMAYDDVIRVADAKTRRGRSSRIRDEVAAAEGTLLRTTEYTHPGAAEVVSLMPARLARRISARPKLMAFIDRRVNRGRHIRSDRVRGFLSLYIVAGLRRWRRRSLRHETEMAHIEDWLDLCSARLGENYDFAVQTLACRRLIKGYSDTHARGLSRFDRVIAGSKLVAGRKDAADWTRRLIEAALADHEEKDLEGALATIRSFSNQNDTPEQPVTNGAPVTDLARPLG